MLIVTLTSVPPRFAEIGATLRALVAQTEPADRVILYIPARYRRFPDWDGTLPKVPAGVEIVRTDQDYGPATKVLPAVRAFAGQDVDILFCDDDRLYAPDMAARFRRLRARHPGTAITLIGRNLDRIVPAGDGHKPWPRALRRWRVTDVPFQLRLLWRRIRFGKGAQEPPRKQFLCSGHVDLFEGTGGVLVRPEYFDAVAFDIPDVAFTVDDVWLSGMVARKGVPIWMQLGAPEPPLTAAERHAPLVRSVVAGVNRVAANTAAAAYLQQTYGIWPKP